MWFFLTLIAAFCIAGHYACVKYFLQREDGEVLAGILMLTTAVFLFAVSWIRGFPLLQEGFWFALLVSSVLNFGATALMYRALAITDLSLVMPLRALSPVLLIGTSWVILHEIPSTFGLVGITLIVIGSYTLGVRAGTQFRLIDPLAALFRDRGVRLMLWVVLIISLSPNYNKLVVLYSDPYFGQALMLLFIGLVFVLLSFP